MRQSAQSNSEIEYESSGETTRSDKTKITYEAPAVDFKLVRISRLSAKHKVAS